jgi:hypothetical protein
MVIVLLFRLNIIFKLIAIRRISKFIRYTPKKPYNSLTLAIFLIVSKFKLLIASIIAI